MRRIFILMSGIFLMLILAGQASYAQNIKVLKTRGPMYITSVAFFQGLTRIPYNVEPGMENAVQNGKQINFSNVTISQFLGFQFNPHLALGAGINFEYWTTKTGFVPLYVDFRVNMTDKKIAPHWYINTGYAVRWNIDSKPYTVKTGTGLMYGLHGYTSGWMGETGIGIKASVGWASAILITLAAKAQESSLGYYAGETLSPGTKPLLVNTPSHSVYISMGLKASIVF